MNSDNLSLNADISVALQVLEQLQETVDASGDEKLQAQTKDDINLLLSVFQNPILRSIATIQGSLSELDTQLQEHPSILPADFNISESGELELNVQRSLYDADFGSPHSSSREYDDQRVPQLSTGEPSLLPKLKSADENISLAPITTHSYALEFQKVIEENTRGREIVTVQLFKPDGNSLGFTVVGLRSEEKGELGIYIQEIQPNGIAARDGRLRDGDQILAIDGQPLDANISHQQAIGILQQARGVVELVIARALDSAAHSPTPSALSDVSKTGSDMLTSEWAQVEVIDLINDGSGLGFGIVGGRSTGVVVKTILPGGVADKDGRLQSGDHILQIGEVNLRGMGSEQVAAVLRQSGSHVRIVVARPVDSPDYRLLESNAPVVPSHILSDADELNKYLTQSGYPEINSGLQIELDDYVYENGCSDAVVSKEVSVPLLKDLPPLTMDMISSDSISHLPDTDTFDVELKKDDYGLGITIAGYVCEKEELSGIFVKSISEGSAADVSKMIQMNDRIVEVDGKSLQGMTNHEAVEVLKSTGKTVILRLERYLRGPKFQQLQMAIANSELSVPPLCSQSPTESSFAGFPTGEKIAGIIDATETECYSPLDLDAPDMAVDLEALIDCDYVGPLKSSVEAAIRAKWRKLMGSPVDIVIGQLCKFNEGGGLGISLEGTVDVENGKEVRPHHYIRSILPQGPVGRNGRLRSGDELLEVNGHRLLGMNHIDVVAILKELPKHVRMVCARRDEETPPIPLINTSQDRTAFAARNILGGSLQNLIPSQDRLVKAKSDGSLASSGTATENSLSKLKSRSLEPLTGLAMWSSEIHIIELIKGERGLGFSILDYQDPMNPNETIIVIRSLVPGGVAQLDGRLIPGDRLLSVNDSILENASLDQAVQVLKGAPKGMVRIGVAKPLPIVDSVSMSSQAVKRKREDAELGKLSYDTDQDENSTYSCADSLPNSPQHAFKTPPKERSSDKPPIPEKPCRVKYASEHAKCKKKASQVLKKAATLNERQSAERTIALEVTPDLVAPMCVSVGNGDGESDEETISEGVKSYSFPGHLERNIKISKGCKPLGLSLKCIGDGVNGMLVTEITASGAFSADGRVAAGDYLLSVNNETLRRCTQSQARSILTRTQLLSTDIAVRYVCRKDALNFWKSAQDSNFNPTPPPSKYSQISPRIFPQYYRSPYVKCGPASKSCEALLEGDSSVGNNRGSLLRSKQLYKSDHIPFGKTFSYAVDIPISEPKAKSREDFQHRDSRRFSCCNLRGQEIPTGPLHLRRFSSTGVRVGDEMTAESDLLTQHWGCEKLVTVHKDGSSLGISIVGGKVDLYDASVESRAAVSGIFVKNVSPDSPAGITGKLKTGDRILEVDGVDVRNADHEDAVKVIRASGDPVTFLIQSLVQWKGESESGSENLLDSSPSTANISGMSNGHVKSNGVNLSEEGKTDSKMEEDFSPSIDSENLLSLTERKRQLFQNMISSAKSKTFVISNRGEERVKTKAGRLIMQSSAGSMSVDDIVDDEEEDEFGYTKNKVKRKYYNLGDEVLIVELEKDSCNGLGLSLAGHKDRTKMAVFVCGLNPKGPAYKAGNIKVGDQILEVNGTVVHGRCHLNASAIIKGLVGPLFKLIIHRREDNVEDLAVKPLTQFPICLEEETPEEKYANFKGLRIFSMKKGPQGLGIMIIEGKHAEAGRGIFISDIQENSIADQAGLLVGDMILSVNKDSLVGCSYDAATTLLKNAEGIVTLVVCNSKRIATTDATADQKVGGGGVASATMEVPVKEPEAPRDPATSPVIPGVECLLEFQKDNIAMGVKIVGGCDTLLPVILVHEVYPEGAAGKDGRLRTGDQLVEVNGHDFRIISNADASRVLTLCRGKVAMLVYRDQILADPTTARETDIMDIIDIEVMKKSKGLGLSVGCKKNSPGVFISSIVSGGALSSDGRIMSGDQILEMNGKDLRKVSQPEAAYIMKFATGKVHLKLGRMKAKMSPSTTENEVDWQHLWNESRRVVILRRGFRGGNFGFTIVGGCGGRRGDFPVFVSSIHREEWKRLMQKGDEIVAVDGIPLKGKTHLEAVTILKAAKDAVALTLR